MENKNNSDLVVIEQSTLNLSKPVLNIFRHQVTSPIIAIIILTVLFSVFTETFISSDNIMNILRNMSINFIIATGLTFVIIAGGIDLSVGSVVALSGAIAVGVFQATDSSWMGLLACLAVGTIVGLFNGIMIAKFDIQPFIMTLVTMIVARGATYMYTDGSPISNVGETIQWVGRGYLLGIPNPIIIMLVVFFVSWFILKRSTIGRYVYAIGGNPEAAKLSGINVDKYKIFTYAFCGFTASLAAVILISRLNSAAPNMGTNFEMDAVAAVVIGGTLLIGGTGSILGTLIGATLIGVLLNGMNMLGVDAFAQYIVKGAVILLAMLIYPRSKGN
jgi:ribose transport system permease protein